MVRSVNGDPIGCMTSDTAPLAAAVAGSRMPLTLPSACRQLRQDDATVRNTHQHLSRTTGKRQTARWPRHNTRTAGQPNMKHPAEFTFTQSRRRG